MITFQHFLTCYFHQNEGFDKLDNCVDRFKQEPESSLLQLINELHEIIQTNNYTKASRIIEKYGGKIFKLDKTEKFINYLYDRLLDRPTKMKATDFIKKCRLIFCPVCTPDPEAVMEFGIIDKATVIDKNIEIYICKPCKLVWIDENDIRADNAFDYKKFMKSNGLKGLWKELKDIDVL
jgi:hypothetical protein